MTLEEKIEILRRHGFHVGNRDFRLNTDYPGRYMVAEPYEESELPTKTVQMGRSVVGDDLETLVEDGYDFLLERQG